MAFGLDFNDHDSRTPVIMLPFVKGVVTAVVIAALLVAAVLMLPILEDYAFTGIVLFTPPSCVLPRRAQRQPLMTVLVIAITLVPVTGVV